MKPKMKPLLVRDFSDNSYTYRLPKVFDPSGLLYSIQFTGYEEIGANYHLRRSDFDSFMLTYTISGQSNLIYDDKYYMVPENSLMFIDCKKPHETWANPDPRGYTIIYLHIHNRSLADFFNYIFSLASPVILFERDELSFVDTVKEIHKSIADGSFDARAASEKIYSLLLSLKSYVEKSSPKASAAPDYINRLITYISEHYGERLTLGDCAAIVNMSPNYLEVAFSKYTGCPVAKYISNFRLKISENLLVTTDDPVSKIAASVGLDGSQALIRLFRRSLGTTPLAYRKAARRTEGKGE